MPRGVKPKDSSRDQVAYENYAKHWGLIKKHMATGAYVEVLTSLEKIISARLLTYLTDFTPVDTANLKRHESSFHGLIKLWKHCEPNPIRDKRYDDLQTAVDSWREKRNTAVHDGLKRAPGKMLVPFGQLDVDNKIAADEGILLAKSVQNWLDRVKYKWEKKEKKSIPNPRHK